MRVNNIFDPNVKNLKNYINSSVASDLIVDDLRIVTSGYLINDPKWSSAPHMHDSAELIFCINGKGTSTILNEKYDVESGDLILLNPNTPHYEISDITYPLEFFFVGFTGFKLPDLPDNTLINSKCCPIQKTGGLKNQFEIYFRELVKETIYCQKNYIHIAKAMTFSILALIMRIFNIESNDGKRISPHSIRIKEYIDENFSTDLNLSQLSSAVYISHYYISHLFKADIGISPMQYLLRKRISHAKELLSLTSDSISKIALECGYDDPAYFSQIFKRLCGCSPRSFRERFRSE